MEASKTISGVRKLVAVAVVAVAAVVFGAGSSTAATPKLVATVGPGFTISLTSAGKKVTSLKPGKYTIAVNDRSRIHDFRLRGPGVNKVFSTVTAVGTKSVTISLRAGRYQFTCQPHAGAMRGAFTVR